MRLFQFVFVALCFLLCTSRLSGATYYWVGGSGDWSQNNLHWATTSGGMIFHAQAPTANDDVVFDANSFTAVNQMVTINGTLIANCRNMNWTGALFTPTISATAYPTGPPYGELRISGSLTLCSSMYYYFASETIMTATTLGNTIRTNGTAMRNLVLQGASGEWILQDSMTIYGTFTLKQGTFRTNNFGIKATDFICTTNSTKAIFLGTSKITAGTLSTLGTFSTFDSQNSKITCPSIVMGPNKWFGTVVIPTASFPSLQGSTSTRINRLEVSASNTQFSMSDVTKIFYFDAVCDVQLGNIGFGKLIVRKNYTEGTRCTFDTLMLRNGGYIARFWHTGVHTITSYMDAFSGNPCQQINIASTSTSVNAVFSKTSGSVVCSDLVMSGITAQGGASFTATNTIAASNVIGWVITGPAPRTLYWIGGTGSWSQLSHWSSSSGGSANQCFLPSSVDNVIFDANSFPISTQKCTLNVASISVNNITWTGWTGTRTFVSSVPTVTMNVYGSWNSSARITWQITSSIVNFVSTSTGKTVNTNRAVLGDVYFDASAGGWTLTDSLSCAVLNINRGFFDTQGNNINAAVRMSVNNVGNNVELRTSIIDASDLYLIANPAGTSIDADSAELNCTNLTIDRLHLVFAQAAGNAVVDNSVVDTLIITGTGQIIGSMSTIHYARFINSGTIATSSRIDWLQADNNLLIDNNSDFGTLQLSTPGRTVSVTPGCIINLTGTIIANGTCSNPITIRCAIIGFTGTFTKTSGTVNCYGMIIRDIIAQGGATFNAYQSVGISNTTGWNIYGGSGTSLYWVGGSGNWNDPAHWSLTSGGTGGSCIPTLTDDVVFDAASFSGPATVNVNVSTAYCRNMTWSGFSGTPVFAYSGSAPYYEIQIAGSMNLVPSINWLYDGTLHFVGTGINKTVDLARKTIDQLIFDGAGSRWTLQDSINVDSVIVIHGNLRSNSHLLRVNHMCPYGDTLDLGSSLVITEDWDAVDQSHQNVLKLPNNNSTIITNTFYALWGTYNKIHGPSHFQAAGCYIKEFIGNSQGSLLMADDIFNTGERDTFEYAEMNSAVTINGSFHRFGYLKLNTSAFLNGRMFVDSLWCNNPGASITVKKDTTLTIGGDMWFSSSAGLPITITSSISGGTAYISKSVDTVCAEYLVLKDIHAIGGALFYAGIYSVNSGNNSGWLFTSCSIPFTDVWPGDVNADYTVDNLDAIYLGIAYGTSSYTRAGANISWSAQPCQEWPFVYTNLVNVNNADCDGNGTVDTLDVGAIVANYGMTRPPIAPPQSMRIEQTLTAGVPLFFQPASLYYSPGDTVSIPVYLGTSGSPVVSGYGLATSIVYDPTRIVVGTTEISLGNSWFTPQGNRLELVYDNPTSNTIEFTDTRKNGQNISGSGQIGIFKFVLSNSATDSVQLSFADSHLLDVDQNDIPISEQTITIYIQALPVANFVAGTPTLCAGGSVNFTDQSTNSPTSWQWSFPGGSPSSSTNQNPTIAYNVPGTYDVTLTVTNAAGPDFQTRAGYVVVNALPSVGFNSTPSSQSVCAGQSVTLSGIGAISYSWSGGVVDGNAFAPSATSTYTVTGTDGNGCTSTAQATIAVDPVPTLTITTTPSNGIVCTGTQATLIASGAQNYSWTGGVINGVPFTPTSTATYVVIGADGNGCTATAQATITVDPVPTLTITATPSNGIVCTGSQATLIASGASSYSWTGGVTNAVPFTPVLTSTYTVTGTGANGCTSTASSTITVTPCSSGTQLSSAWCGRTNLNLSQWLYHTPISGATNYQYLLTNTVSGATHTRIKGNYQPNMPLSWIPGILYGQTYFVQIRGFVGGVWGAYGPQVCTISLGSAAQQLSLNATSCNATGLTSASYLYSNSVAGATSYRFTLTSGAYTQTQTRTVPNVRLSQFSGLTPNTTYTVTVTEFSGGLWSAPIASPVCTITLGSVLRLANPESEETDFVEPFAFATLLYPNPIGENVTPMISISGADGQEANVSIVDINGRVLFTYLFFVEGDEFTAALYGFPDLVAAIYIMQVQIGDKVQNTKFIVE